MATNLALNDALIRAAMKWGKHKTKRAAVTAALENYIRLRKLDGWDQLAGTVEYYDSDPKPGRHPSARKRRAAK